MTVKLSKQAKDIVTRIEKTRDTLYITGKAGTGKSTLLDHIRLHSKKKIIVLAPTGISAINVNGETLHSFFLLKPGYELDEAKKMKINHKMKKKLKRIKTIAIDEISMVRADLLDAVDTVLKKARQSNEPFGGVQMIFFGDLFQLPPVVTPADRDKLVSEYDSPYFFDANVFHNLGQNDLFSNSFVLNVIELKKIYRQKDSRLINVLNAVRNNEVSDEHLNILNTRFVPDFVPKKNDKYIYLVTTNVMADRINSAELKKLKQKETVISAKKSGKVARNLYPNNEEIALCVGAQVMFICNDSERRFVNGTIGKVVNIEKFLNCESGEDEFIVSVEKSDGSVIEVKKYNWEISRYVFEDGEFTRDVMGSYQQIPLKLAWAITIHKSQGKTFDKVIIDLGHGSFAHGQTYVALSRCTSLNGIVLKKKLSRSSIITDSRVKDFY